MSFLDEIDVAFSDIIGNERFNENNTTRKNRKRRVRHKKSKKRDFKIQLEFQGLEEKYGVIELQSVFGGREPVLQPLKLNRSAFREKIVFFYGWSNAVLRAGRELGFEWKDEDVTHTYDILSVLEKDAVGLFKTRDGIIIAPVLGGKSIDNLLIVSFQDWMLTCNCRETGVGECKHKIIAMWRLAPFIIRGMVERHTLPEAEGARWILLYDRLRKIDEEHGPIKLYDGYRTYAIYPGKAVFFYHFIPLLRRNGKLMVGKRIPSEELVTEIGKLLGLIKEEEEKEGSESEASVKRKSFFRRLLG